MNLIRMCLLRPICFSLLLNLALLGCGGKLKILPKVPVQEVKKSGTQPPDSQLPDPLSCADPLRAAFSAPPAFLTSATPVVWSLTLSGGCTSQYQLEGVLAGSSVLIVAHVQQDGRFLYPTPKFYPSGSGRQETVTVRAFKSDGSLFQALTMSSIPFNVADPEPGALSCEALVSQPLSLTGAFEYNSLSNSAKVNVDFSGHIIGPILPELRYVVTFLQVPSGGGAPQPVSGHIVNVSPLAGSSVSVAAPASFSTSDESSQSLTLRFLSSGPNGVQINVTKGSATAHCQASLNLLNVYPPVPHLSIGADALTIPNSSATFITWSAGSVFATNCAVTDGNNIRISNDLSGRVSTGLLTRDTTYMFRCDQGSPVSVTVSVLPPPPQEPVQISSGLRAYVDYPQWIYSSFLPQNLVTYTDPPFSWNSGKYISDGVVIAGVRNIYVTVDLGAGYALAKVRMRFDICDDYGSPMGHQKWLIQVAGNQSFSDASTILTVADIFTGGQWLEIPVGAGVNAQYGNGIRFIRAVAQDDGQFVHSWIALNRIEAYRNP